MLTQSFNYLFKMSLNYHFTSIHLNIQFFFNHTKPFFSLKIEATLNLDLGIPNFHNLGRRALSHGQYFKFLPRYKSASLSANGMSSALTASNRFKKKNTSIQSQSHLKEFISACVSRITEISISISCWIEINLFSKRN